MYLVGNNETEAYDSVHAVRHMVDTTPPPHGVKAYVTGPAALNADQAEAGDKSIAKVTAITSMVIAAMLLVIYRSVITAVLVLIMVGIDLGAIRGFIALLADHNIFSLSTFATNLLVLMAIAASTDYAIFMLGRYHESRYAGEDRETAFYTMFHGTAHVILGSGLTIAGAMYCLSFARLPYFETLARHCYRHAGRGLGGAHARPGRTDRGQLLQAVRSQAADEHSAVAPGGNGNCALAGAGARGDMLGRLHWLAGLASSGQRMICASSCPPACRPMWGMRRLVDTFHGLG